MVNGGGQRATTIAGPLYDRNLDPAVVEGDVVLDLGHRSVRLLVLPDGVLARLAGQGDAEVAGVALVRAVALVVGALEQRLVDVGERDVVDDRVARLLQLE